MNEFNEFKGIIADDVAASVGEIFDIRYLEYGDTLSKA